MDLTIPEFFRDKCVFITGGTGFMGKVLIEKLVRSCSSISKIYILVRQKREKNPKDRLREIIEQPVFQRVKNELPGALERILVPIQGDVTQKRLGLSKEDEEMLQNQVSVVFHVAASVRFDDPVKDAVFMNTRGTHEIVALAKKMAHLKALLHVSTTYCNCMRPEVDEKVYPVSLDWREAIDVAETVDPEALNILSLKYLDNFPNTYTFTKNLAEQVILEHKDELPVIIFRPSIVISSLKEPMPGWMDNFNGPVGLLVGIGKGVIRTTMASKKTVPDYMPVDIAIKAMIVATWLIGTRREKVTTDLPVYNSSTMSKSISSGQLNDIGMEALMRYPFQKVLWYPGVVATGNHTCFYVNVILQHLIPGFLIDTYLKLKGQKPILITLYRRYYLAILALNYFTCKSWTFYNKKFLGLLSKIHPLDHEDFDFNFEDIEPVSFFEEAVKGGHKYLLKNDLKNLPQARKNIRRMYWLDRTIKGVCTAVAIWYLCSERTLNVLLFIVKRFGHIFLPMSS